MFRRKDEDIAQDLLGNADTEMTNNDASGQSEDSAPATRSETSSAANGASASASPAPATSNSNSSAPSYSRTEQPSRAPSTANYRQPIDYGRNRMQDFRAGGNAPASAAGGSDKAKSGSRRVLTVGNDILLKGEIATCDRLVIEGEVDATLNEVHTVEIAETGSFKGSAQIEDAEISGLFEGELVVRNRLVIYSTGQVRGKITYGEIEIERGGELTGEIKTTSQNSKAKASGKNDKAKPDAAAA